ncbi:MAG: V-type ATP synthase subunit A, partial [Ruminococcaceae bacterium]|nr:V-type ATP synthase subunit A [Oscillospiraceae bacterium]
VTQATLRIVKVFWGLDASLAYRRHFPAINWLNSYSLYRDRLTDWFSENVSKQWMTYTGRCLKTLQVEADLQEIVKLVGMDALSASDRLTLDTAQSIREDFLQQNAFLDIDCYTPLEKQYGILDLIFTYEDLARRAIEAGADIDDVCALPVHERIGRAKTAPNDGYRDEFEEIKKEISLELDRLVNAAENE